MAYLMIPPVNGSMLANASVQVPLLSRSYQSSSLVHLYPEQEKLMCEMRHQQFIYHISSIIKPENSPLARPALVRFLEMTATPERLGGLKKINEARYKEKGYISRLSGKESWFDWSENRTELGYAIDNMLDILTDDFPVETLVAKLDPKRLSKANEEARIFLEKLNPIVVKPIISRRLAFNNRMLINSDILERMSGFETITVDSSIGHSISGQLDLSDRKLLDMQSYCQVVYESSSLAGKDGLSKNYSCLSSVTPLSHHLSVVVEGRRAFLSRNNVRVPNSEFTISPNESLVISPNIVALSDSRFVAIESTHKGIFSRVFDVGEDRINLLNVGKKITDFAGNVAGIRLSNNSFLIVRTAISEKHGVHRDIHVQALKIDEINNELFIDRTFKANTVGHHGHRPSDLSAIALSEEKVLVTWKASEKEPESPRLFYGQILFNNQTHWTHQGATFQLSVAEDQRKVKQLHMPKVVPIVGQDNFFMVQWGEFSIGEISAYGPYVHTSAQIFYANPNQRDEPPIKIGHQFNSLPCHVSYDDFSHGVYPLPQGKILSVRRSGDAFVYEGLNIIDRLSERIQ